LLVVRSCVNSPPSSLPPSNSEINWDPRRNSSVDSVAHASELIWNQSCQILAVCIQCWCVVLRRHHRTKFMTRTDSDLLLLLGVTNRLRIWFDHGQRNRICVFICILFHRFGLLLLLLLTCNNMNCECLCSKELLPSFHLNCMSICIVLCFLPKTLDVPEQLLSFQWCPSSSECDARSSQLANITFLSPCVKQSSINRSIAMSLPMHAGNADGIVAIRPHSSDHCQ